MGQKTKSVFSQQSVVVVYFAGVESREPRVMQCVVSSSRFLRGLGLWQFV